VKSPQGLAEPRTATSDAVRPPRQFAARPARFFPVRGPVARRLRLIALLLGPALGLAAYAWFSARGDVSEAILPTLGSVARASLEVLSGPEFWTDLGYSFLRVSAGFVAAALFAVPLGILGGSFRLWASLLEPSSEFLRYVPVPALIPLVMIVAGIDEGAKVLLVFAGTFFQLLLMTADEVRRVPLSFVQVSQSMGASRFEVAWKVLTPAALPGISHALRLCNGWAWSYVVVAELVAATEGMGFRVLRFYRFIQTPQIYVYLLAFGVVGFALDGLFRLAHRRVFRWSLAGAR
jgi:NitT/TauT family transport system permease protein